MTSVRSEQAVVFPPVSRPVSSGPARVHGAAAVWHWLVHNVRVAFQAPAEGERALRQRPEALRSLIQRAAVALVITRDGDGRLHAQPMSPLQRAFDGEIWFPATASMPVVAHVLGRADIQIMYLDPASAHRCVVLEGIARVFERTGNRFAALRARLARWRPAGSRVDAPSFIRVDIVSADVWE